MSRPPITRAHPYTPQGGLFAGQTYSSERQYRNALARAKGYRSWAEQQRAPAPPVKTREDRRRLRPSARGAHERVASALSEWRRHPEWSREDAAHAAHTTSAAIHRYGGDALERTAGGRYHPRETDRYLRRLAVLAPAGVVYVDTRSSEDAHRVAEYWQAVNWYLRTGDPSRLAQFHGRGIRAGKVVYPFLADLDALDELGRRGELSFEEIYERP